MVYPVKEIAFIGDYIQVLEKYLPIILAIILTFFGLVIFGLVVWLICFAYHFIFNGFSAKEAIRSMKITSLKNYWP